MSKLTIYTTKPSYLKADNFYPRNYDPVFLYVKEKLGSSLKIENFLIDDVIGGSTPPYYLFRDIESGVPFVKTSAINRDFVNVNDLHYIHKDFHSKKIARSITKPYDVIYSMTGKFMGKAAICPPNIPELNMSQNSVVLRTNSPEQSAFLTVFLNSVINRTQVTGSYSITKQKYINQGKIAQLRMIEYKASYKKFCVDYINGIKDYYAAVENIRSVIKKFNSSLGITSYDDNESNIFKIRPRTLNRKILTANYYQNEGVSANLLSNGKNAKTLKQLIVDKGDEIGSDKYLFEGIPFIKTSNFQNFGVDYQPNYYCSESIYNELEQDLKAGDIIFTKDGNIGEVAVIEESAKIVISSGIVRIRVDESKLRYWLFLLLSSDYGKTHFKKWGVIASTMAHLRKDFFTDFSLPEIPSKYDGLVKELSKAFQEKKKAFHQIEQAKENLLAEFNKLMV